MITQAEVKLPEAVLYWLSQFKQEAWSGSLTLHYNRGTLLSYEPKPNLKIVG
jgi:hypothetical protein